MSRYAAVAALFATDAYKLDHIHQYLLSGRVERIYSNYTNRKSRIKGVTRVVHFGLQAYIQQYLMDAFAPFFEASENEVCWLYFERLEQVLGEEKAQAIGTDHIRALHRLGYLPLRFCAVPEGTRVPIRVPCFTIENTHDEFFWLVNYIEPGLSAGIWQPATSATIALRYRTILEDAAWRTGADLADVDFQCHDFSFRGMSSHESAASSAAGHLLSFKGTDSMVVLDWIDQYYGGEYEAKSVPATEHSVMSAGIASIGEEQMLESLLNLYPTGTVSVVSDTFDLWKVIMDMLPSLKDVIMQRDGKLVIRPDSGDPESILCGNPRAEDGSPEFYGVVRLLANLFGTTRNAKGFKRLNEHIGTIYGDSITVERAESIVAHLEQMGFVSTTVTLGVGSFTYQYNTRDTFGSAIKATWAKIAGKVVNLFKDPVTDDGTKKSATGRLAVVLDLNGEMTLIETAAAEDEARSLLQPVWEDGHFIQRQSFADVRKTLQEAL